MNAASVTIVIPTYNDAPGQLVEAVESAKQQTHPDVEIIVVDDGSDVPVVLDGIRLVRQVNAGPASARNAGIMVASGHVVITLDADDRLSPDYAAEAVSVLGADDQARIAYPRVQEFGERSAMWWPGAGRKVTLEEFAVHSPVAVTSAFRRADWEAIGGFDESLRIGHEDYEFWVRLLGERGGYAAPMPTATLYYRIRPFSRARTRWAEARGNTRRAIVERASRDTLAALLVGAETHARKLEVALAQSERDFLNLRAWPFHLRRVVRRLKGFRAPRRKTAPG